MSCAPNDGVEGGIASGDLGRWLPGIGGNPGSEKFVEQHPDREDVSALVDRIGIAEDLRGGVAGRAPHRLLGVVFLPHRPGQAEVTNFRLGARAEEDVAGLDVAVQNAGPVGVGEAMANACHQAGRLGLLDRLCRGRNGGGISPSPAP